MERVKTKKDKIKSRHKKIYKEAKDLYYELKSVGASRHDIIITLKAVYKQLGRDTIRSWIDYWEE